MASACSSLSDDDFSTLVESVRTKVSDKAKNQKEEFERYAKELTTHDYLFDRQEQEKEALGTISKQEFQAYF